MRHFKVLIFATAALAASIAAKVPAFSDIITAILPDQLAVKLASTPKPDPIFAPTLTIPSFADAVPDTQNIKKGKYFDRIITIIMENEGLEKVSKDPYFASLMNSGLGLRNYHGVAHPSQPNYIAQVYGDFPNAVELPNLHLDKRVHIVGDNIVDLLERGGVSWKTYQEGLPGNGCYQGDNGHYVRKHNPFISMVNVANNPARCAKIANFNQLVTDVKEGKVPQYVFITPNMLNDGHDTSIKYSAQFLQSFLYPLMKSPNFKSSRTLIIVTYDESEKYYDANTVYAALIGDVVNKNADPNINFNHYSIVKTVEENWDLGTLGRKDATATSLAPVFVNYQGMTTVTSPARVSRWSQIRNAVFRTTPI